MKHITPFRIAAVLLFVFCVMHTGGGMLAQKSLGPASDAVFEAMKRVHFDFNGADCTWYGFWFGFGLTASIFLLLSALVAWELERVPSELWSRLGLVPWAFVAAHVGNTVLAWKYFFAGPGVFGALISLLLAVGTLRKSRRAASGIANA
jgi:prolipoprotein diacylglyceryltransferase